MKTATAPKGRRTSGKPGRRAGKTAGAPTHFGQFNAFDGRADDLPADLAHQHDHYLYGTSKHSR